MIFVATNYFLRFLLDDNPEQGEIAKKLFRQAARGEKKLVSSTIVFFEIYWVLSSYYGKQRGELAKTLFDILAMVFIEFDDREILTAALERLARENLDLEDCYNLSFARARTVSDFATLDFDLKKKINANL